MKKRTGSFTTSSTAIALLALSVSFGGCSQSGSQDKGGGNEATSPAVQVDAPKTEVNVGGDGIQVDAPGVEVKVGGGDGVQVEAPGTHVDLGGEK